MTGSPEAYRQTLLGHLDARLLQNRHARRVVVFLLGLVLVIPAVQMVNKIQEVDHSAFRDTGERRRTALGRWMPTAEILGDEDPQTDPYGSGHWFPLPPLVLMAIKSLTNLGHIGAGVIWVALKLAGIAIVLLLLLRSMRFKEFAVPLGVVVMMALFAFRPVIADLQHGNVNIFMLIWLALCWVMYVGKRDVWAGLFLSLAIVTKITPALVLVYFLYKRAWKLSAATGIGLVLWFVVIPSLYLGFSENMVLLQSWFEMLVGPYMREGWVTATEANQSLYGVLLRLANNAGLVAVEDIPLSKADTAGMLDMFRPVSPYIRMVRPLIPIAFLGVLGILCRTRTELRRDMRLLIEFSLVLLTMLLLSERTWKHHGTTLVIVYLGVWYVLTCVSWSDRFRAGFVAGLIAQWVLLVGTSSGILGDDLAEIMLNGGAFCWGLLLCFVQTAVMLWRAGRLTPAMSAPGGHSGLRNT